jgi:hypothetical protein
LQRDECAVVAAVAVATREQQVHQALVKPALSAGAAEREREGHDRDRALTTTPAIGRACGRS